MIMNHKEKRNMVLSPYKNKESGILPWCHSSGKGCKNVKVTKK